MKRGIDYIGVGVGAAIFNAEGKLLLMLRGKKAQNEQGTWEIPGGAVEFGETLTEALQREVMEEIGVTITVGELLDIYDHMIPHEKQHWVAPTYLCTISKGTPVIQEPEKSEQLGWYTLQQAQTLPLSLVTRRDVETLLRRYPQGVPSR